MYHISNVQGRPKMSPNASLARHDLSCSSPAQTESELNEPTQVVVSGHHHVHFSEIDGMFQRWYTLVMARSFRIEIRRQIHLRELGEHHPLRQW